MAAATHFVTEIYQLEQDVLAILTTLNTQHFPKVSPYVLNQTLDIDAIYLSLFFATAYELLQKYILSLR